MMPKRYKKRFAKFSEVYYWLKKLLGLMEYNTKLGDPALLMIVDWIARKFRGFWKDKVNHQALGAWAQELMEDRGYKPFKSVKQAKGSVVTCMMLYS